MPLNGLSWLPTCWSQGCGRGLFFVFKQKTAYEMIWCWSSDVCSSDLVLRLRNRSEQRALAGRPRLRPGEPCTSLLSRSVRRSQVRERRLRPRRAILQRRRRRLDRKSVVEGKRGSVGGRRLI